MTSYRRLSLIPAAALAVLATSAAAAPAVQVNSGDTAWVLLATALVMLMIIPGLALFYSGLVRTKNVLSMLTQVFSIVCVVSMLWVIFGYSLTFTSGSVPALIGGTSKMFLRGIGPETTIPTFSNGIEIPEFVYIIFQMTISCIPPALMVGAFAERMRYQALLMLVVNTVDRG